MEAESDGDNGLAKIRIFVDPAPLGLDNRSLQTIVPLTAGVICSKP
jgi:hypothetical protein